MNIELRDSLENLYPDSKVGKVPCVRLSLDVARAGIIAVHVLLNGLKKGVPVRVSLRSKQGTVKGAEWFRLVDVPVRENSGFLGMREDDSAEGANKPNPHVIRRAPFRTYDPMEPVSPTLKAPGSSLALRLHVPVARKEKPGRREFLVQVKCGTENVRLTLEVRVHKVVIPAVGAKSYPYTNWFSFANMAASHGLRPWSAGHWKMIQNYAELMVHGRQNMFWFTFSDVFTVRRKRPVLNAARLRRIVDIFTKAGMYYIEGCHVAHRGKGGWNAKGHDVNGLKGVAATSAEGNAFLADALRQLKAEIDRNGWKNRWIQHVADEPNASSYEDYRILVGLVRKYFQGIPILDAVVEARLAGSVDYWCPPIHYYGLYGKEYEVQRRVGDQIWYYTCCFPGGPWLNRFLDHELIRPVLLGWAGALFKFDGFLHWGLNHYSKKHDPFKDIPRVRGQRCLPAGDTHIVYPGKRRPWSSLRLEAHREGFEDLELLKSLQAKDPAAAAGIMKKVIRGLTEYTKDLKQFRAARRALMEAESVSEGG